MHTVTKYRFSANKYAKANKAKSGNRQNMNTNTIVPACHVQTHIHHQCRPSQPLQCSHTQQQAVE